MRKHKIFLSYSHREGAWAKEFAKALAERGLDVWFDEYSIAAGEPVADAIERGLRESDVFVTVIDPSLVASPSLLFEVGAALGMGKKIVAVVPKDFDARQLPHALRVRRYLVKDSPEATAEELAASEEPRALDA